MLKAIRQKRVKYTGDNDVMFIKSGKGFFDALEGVINLAKRHIHLQTYVFEEDETGRRIVNALKGAAKRGVQVYLVLDAYGSRSLSSSFLNGIMKSGIKFRWFGPLLSSQNLSIGRRLHHKVIVVDSEISIVGGINIADRYNDIGSSKSWLDFAVIVKGDVSKQLFARCNQIWGRKYQLRIRKREEGQVFMKLDQEKNMKVRITVNDWLRNKIAISDSYKRAFSSAEKTITIVGSYFVPGSQLRRRLRQASKRGVQVRIILSNKTDSIITKYAARYLYRWFLDNKIEIYEWKGSVVHGKVAIIDGKLTTIGSYNLNYLSAYGSVELNLEIANSEFSGNFENYLGELMEKGCELITKEYMSKKESWLDSVLEWFAYHSFKIAIRAILSFGKRTELK